MRICDKVRNYILSKGLKLNYVADKTGMKRGKFYRIISGASQMTIDEFELVCRLGLSVNPTIFFEDNFSEIEKSNQKPA
ncbi:helix-turn-helix transcriptional regulator [Brevibacillus sp. HB2.2]|uniref:helix-turn-helix domain-containing protein n=1 Tax=Brevibacillus sp. HB2.2 TaxID=2738846 RepID=UPI00156BA1A3|nr:helix-turn-helix transcriptional regulator [Brevibacillus sp. HB2.2]NRS51946.1 helix-turn-helix transcriptional regulator [Brevibacillus sp. HB2.2]